MVLGLNIYKEDMYNNNNMLIFDIGANSGSYSFKKLSSNNNLTIIAIEPLPKTFNTLKINLQHLFVTRSSIHFY